MKEVIAALLMEASRHRKIAKLLYETGEPHSEARLLMSEHERQATYLEIAADFISVQLYKEEAESTRGAPIADYGMPKNRTEKGTNGTNTIEEPAPVPEHAKKC